MRAGALDYSRDESSFVSLALILSFDAPVPLVNGTRYVLETILNSGRVNDGTNSEFLALPSENVFEERTNSVHGLKIIYFSATTAHTDFMALGDVHASVFKPFDTTPHHGHGGSSGQWETRLEIHFTPSTNGTMRSFSARVEYAMIPDNIVGF